MWIVLAGCLCLFSAKTQAITTGDWELYGIPAAIQRVAEEAESTNPPENVDTVPVSDSILQQIYAARAAQYEAAHRYWRRR